MKYLSIIRLFEFCGVNYANLSILQIKKIISAEYSLADNGIISIDGFDYTKDAVLQEIEHEDFTQRLQYHSIIWKNKALLNFLEHDTINNEADTWRSLSNDDGFKQFISPYFAYSFNKVMHKFLRDTNFAKAALLLKFLTFVNYIDSDQALASIRSFISETLRLFKNTSKDNYKNHYLQISIWAKQPAYLFINNLPDTLSSDIENLIIGLINLTITVQNGDKKLCLGISNNLIKINRADPENAQIIKDNHSIYKKNARSGSSFIRLMVRGFITIFCIKVSIFAIALLIGLVSDCSGKNENSKRKKSSFSEYQNYINTHKEHAEKDGYKTEWFYKIAVSEE